MRIYALVLGCLSVPLFAAEPNVGKLSRFFMHSNGGFSLSADGTPAADKTWFVEKSPTGAFYSDSDRRRGESTPDNQVFLQGEKEDLTAVAYRYDQKFAFITDTSYAWSAETKNGKIVSYTECASRKRGCWTMNPQACRELFSKTENKSYAEIEKAIRDCRAISGNAFGLILNQKLKEQENKNKKVLVEKLKIDYSADDKFPLVSADLLGFNSHALQRAVRVCEAIAQPDDIDETIKKTSAEESKDHK